MNIKNVFAYLILCVTPLFFAYRVTVKTAAKERFIVDKKESVVTWKGSMQFISNAENIGFVSISKGELLIEKHNLVGGMFEIDMKTITHKEHGSENGLINHLKSPDFFDTEKYPISTFEITQVVSISGENSKITGNLTIKGVTHSITFPARIESQNEILNASGKVTLDRTQWGIRYRSGKFFDNLADETISDSIEVDIKIVANRTVTR
jgi:polyisoprenoid-binding protein YceI